MSIATIHSCVVSSKKLTVVVFVLILLGCGLFLRLYPLNTAPYWMDEGYTINAVLSYTIGQTEGVSAVLDSGATYECFLYCYPTSLISNAFGASASTYRILAVVFGMLSILVLYVTTRELFNRRTALLTAFFINFAYFQIAWSTQARWYTMFLFFFWLALWLFVRTTKQYALASKLSFKTILLATCCVIATVLTILSQKIGIILPGIFAGYTMYLNYWQKTFRFLPTTTIVTALILISAIVDTLSGQRLLLNFLSNIDFNYNLPYYLNFLWREYLVFIPLALYALYHSNGRDSRALLAYIFLAYLIPLSFLTSIVHYRYIFHVTPILFILGSVGLFDILKNLPLKYTFKYQTPLTIALLITIFFIQGTGVITPQDRYWLEADDPSKLSARPSYAYTPQPDWNTAYDYIKTNRTSNDIVISSHPHFNKIFLREPGYWISFNYLGFDGRNEFRTTDNREFYVGAQIIDTPEQLQQLTSNQHGFIVFDYMAQDGRITPDILDSIDTLPLVFHKKDNAYSEIWVFRF